MAKRNYEFDENDNWDEYKKSSKKKTKPRDNSENNRRLNPRDYADYRYNNDDDYDDDY
jgi:hypothetical protein